MSKQDYLRHLSAALATLVPDRERLEIVRYYEEYFEEAGPEREAELIQELGDPRELAQKIAREGGFSGGETAEAPKKSNRWKWALGITGAVVVLLAGTFAALSALNAQFLLHFDFLPGSSQAASTPPGGTESGTPGSSSPGTESQQPSQGPTDPAAVADFVRLNIEIGLGNVTVRTGADWGLTLESSGQDRYGTDYLIHYTLENQELTIWSTPRSLETAEGNNVDGRVVVTVPEGWTLEQVDIKNGLGFIELDGLTLDEITADLGLGYIECDDLTAGEMDMYNGMGSISLRGPIATRTELESGMGDINVDTDSLLSSCAYELESGMGNIRVDGTSYATAQSKAEGELSLDASTGMGDITVNFGG